MGNSLLSMELNLHCRNRCHVHNIVYVAASLKNVHGFIHSYQDRADRVSTPHTRHQFIAHVTRLKIWENQNICVTLNLAETVALLSNIWNESSVDLHLTIDN